MIGRDACLVGVLSLACSSSGAGSAGNAAGSTWTGGFAGATAGSTATGGGGLGGDGGAAGAQAGAAGAGAVAGSAGCNAGSGGDCGGAGTAGVGGSVGGTANWGPACATVVSMGGPTVEPSVGYLLDPSQGCVQKAPTFFPPSICTVRPPPPNTSGVMYRCASPDGIELYLVVIETDEGFCSDGWFVTAQSSSCPGTNKSLPAAAANMCHAAIVPGSGVPNYCP